MSASSQTRPPVVEVAVGVLQSADGNVLIARRPADKPMGGAWEFPGGKVHAGEARLQGLVRELVEELGVQISYVRFLTRYSHDYPDRRVVLHVWKVLQWDGEPVGVENQALEWCNPADAMERGLLAADRRIIELLAADMAVNRLAPLR